MIDLQVVLNGLVLGGLYASWPSVSRWSGRCQRHQLAAWLVDRSRRLSRLLGVCRSSAASSLFVPARRGGHFCSRSVTSCSATGDLSRDGGARAHHVGADLRPRSSALQRAGFRFSATPRRILLDLGQVGLERSSCPSTGLPRRRLRSCSPGCSTLSCAPHVFAAPSWRCRYRPRGRHLDGDKKGAMCTATTFGLGALMAGAAGCLVAVVFPFSPGLAESLLEKSFVLCVLGGLGTVPARARGRPPAGHQPKHPRRLARTAERGHHRLRRDVACPSVAACRTGWARGV